MFYQVLKGFQTSITKLRCHHMLFRSLICANFLITDFFYAVKVYLQWTYKRYCDDKRKHVVVECNHFKTDVAAKLQEKQNRINSVN